MVLLYLRRIHRLPLAFFFLLSLACQRKHVTLQTPQGEEVLDYNRHVRPILSDNCFACHGPDKNKRYAGLRLDTREGATVRLESGKQAIVPGDPDESEAIRRITSKDKRLVMPPVHSNLSLSQTELDILRTWIEAGAEYKPHWSFIKPEKAPLPEPSDPAWCRNEIDQFLLSAMDRQKLKPQPEASAAELVRRLAFDLTGLPPSERQRQLALSGPLREERYQQLITELMADSAFGERLATDWLDLARYADSHGYQDDGYMFAWPYRDWVIKAFNQNLPFDRFLTWQIAGDLLPKPGRDALVATAFNRIHTQNEEGGIVDEEYRTEYVLDRTNTLAKGLMGLTLECARCHDHKYDPFTQKEYYQMSAFFNQMDESGQVPHSPVNGPTIWLADPPTQSRIDSLKGYIDHLAGKLNRYPAARPTGGSPIQATASLSFDAGIPEGNAHGKDHWERVGTLGWEDGVRGKALRFGGEGYLKVPQIGNAEVHEPFSYAFWLNLDQYPDRPLALVSRMKSVFKAYTGYDLLIENGKLSARLSSFWPANALAVRSRDSLPLKRWNHIALTWNGSGRADGLRLYVNGVRVSVVVKDKLKGSILSDTEKSPLHLGNFSSVPGFIGSTYLRDARMDEWYYYRTCLSEAQVRDLQQFRLPATGPYQTDPDYLRDHAALASAWSRFLALTQDLPQMMVMEETPGIRKTFVLNRGAYDAPGEEVQPGTPSAILPFEKNLPKNRLGLARWLTSREHPLVARVIVNHYWQLIFGRGLVPTPEDFGSQGAAPSHPELLDWLAVDFQEHGWDLRRLIRQMVGSRTYRLSSRAPKAVREKDPENVWLSYGSRYRKPMEMIRDQALAVSGLLVRKVGGESVRPYQPPGLWEETTSGRFLTRYIPQHGDSLYRRSMYTFYKRTSPPPTFYTFDGPDRSYCNVRRQKTNTPLQALIAMNDPQITEAARVLAQKIIKNQTRAPAREWIGAMVKAILLRPATEKERPLLEAFFEKKRSEYEMKPEQAKALLAVGDYPAETALSPVQSAALTQVGLLLFNTDEVLCRE